MYLLRFLGGGGGWGVPSVRSTCLYCMLVKTIFFIFTTA